GRLRPSASMPAYASPAGLVELPLRGSFLRPTAAGQAAVGGLMRGSAPAPRLRGTYPRAPAFVAYHPWRQPFGPSLCDVTNCSCNLLRCIARIPSFTVIAHGHGS